MNDQSKPGARKHTAVLVVHGIGSQRPLDTVRGVVKAVWLGGDRSAQEKRQTSNHPEPSGIDDIDLPVITTNSAPNTDHRKIDFHELYWAHLMSETRAVAVLLWLFELARMGPRAKPSLRAVYWGVLVFLAALVLSISLLAIQITVEFAQLVAARTSLQFDLDSLVYVFIVSIVVTGGFTFLAAIWKGAFKLASWSVVLVVLAAGSFWLVHENESPVENLVRLLLPILVSAIIIKVVMEWWGIVGLLTVVVLSFGAWGFASLHFEVPAGQTPWSITSFWSTVAACYFIAVYLALYAAFLQPYLGDAARYFRNSPGNVAVRREIRRQAVSQLQTLHLSGDYDRIVVVAHSLGSVVAYDMLRAYYSRINQALPNPSLLGQDFDTVDQGTMQRSEAREKGREIIRRMAQAVEDARQRVDAGRAQLGDTDMRAWLVTDFVTLGTPLTHVRYLMCHGKTEDDLRKDFDRRAREREFPTCPPRMLNGDQRLTFKDPRGVRRFHHGGQFALTRWTNLFFPVSQLLWGDAIGGEVGSIFGEPNLPHPPNSNVADVRVFTNSSRRDDFFAHVLYWDRAQGGTAPHVVALKNAIDLADTGAANGL
jgi:hypothetical protein